MFARVLLLMAMTGLVAALCGASFKVGVFLCVLAGIVGVIDREGGWEM